MTAKNGVTIYGSRCTTDHDRLCLTQIERKRTWSRNQWVGLERIVQPRTLNYTPCVNRLRMMRENTRATNATLP